MNTVKQSQIINSKNRITPKPLYINILSKLFKLKILKNQIIIQRISKIIIKDIKLILLAKKI